MFARLARYQVEPERVEDAVEGFREAGKSLRELGGFVNGYLLVDSDTGELSTLTLWRDHRSLDESATRAGAMRLRAIREVDGSCESVASYRVAVEFE